jgi:thiamine-phosphate pyrophosphorylase
MVTPAGVVILTDRRIARRPLTQVVAAAVAGGAGWVVLRERDLAYGLRRALAAALRSLVPPDRLIVAGPDPLGGHAVHLAAAESLPPGVPLVGRSCHDADEIAGLSRESYVTLSPVYPTTTKPGYGPALSPLGAAALSPPVPWLALGGIDTAERVASCVDAGAAGVAVLGAVMRAADPAYATRELVDAFGVVS